MFKAKDDTAQGLTKGIELLFKQNKADYIKGTTSFVSPNAILAQLNEGGEERDHRYWVRGYSGKKKHTTARRLV